MSALRAALVRAEVPDELRADVASAAAVLHREASASIAGALWAAVTGPRYRAMLKLPRPTEAQIAEGAVRLALAGALRGARVLPAVGGCR